MVSIIGDHISDQIRVEGIYEREILEFLRDRVFDPVICKQQIAIDVGANIGNHTLFVSDIFRKVIAFEPNPLARSILQSNLELNDVQNVEVKEVGLSDEPRRAILTFDPVNLGAATSLATVYRTKRSRSSEVDLVAGDNVIDRSQPVGFIKADVEGAEEAALTGLEQTLRTHQPIVMIEQREDVIDSAARTSPAISFLRGIGYSAWEIQPAPLFRRPWGKLSTLLLGRTDHRLCAVRSVDKRNYPALIFTPPSYVFPSHN
jgi:FkbM family methyltransferase